MKAPTRSEGATTPYISQSTEGGCGACALLMVAHHFGRGMEMTETEVLDQFGESGFGPPCMCLVPSFQKAAFALGLVASIKSLSQPDLAVHLMAGPVIVYHLCDERPDAFRHFSVALEVTDEMITRHDPGTGAAIVWPWERFDPLWEAATTPWSSKGRNVVILRPAA